MSKMRDYQLILDSLQEIENYLPASLDTVEMGTGVIRLNLNPVESMFYTVIGEQCGYEIKDELHLIETIRSFSEAKKEFDRIQGALASAKQIGYGLVPPDMNEMELEEPEIVQQGSKP